ncbi:MAG TPA: cytochrome P450 [Acidimicrobiales bacterium]|jgi:cytochrome P450|nr:cytochrome P450 [Acidimicrobiales bacterium]
MLVDDINLSELEFWELPWAERDAAFATLRRERPTAFFEEPELEGMPRGPGYYAICRHADVIEMSRRPELFCSGKGATAVIDMPEFMLEFFGGMINMDDPKHARQRKIVSASFTPRMLARAMDDVVAITHQVLDSVDAKPRVDLVQEISAKLPLVFICNMMGIPATEHQRVFEASNIILSMGDPEYVPDDVNPIQAFMEAGGDLNQLMVSLAAERMEHPTDDLTSALIHAEIDGERLTHEELASFFILLVVAGNETTRNAISHGVWLFDQHPDQRKIWLDDLDEVTPTAVEEIVRYATPVINMRRTVTGDVEVGGQQYHEGDKVLLYYNSANRDEAVFEDPDRFDVRRNPNPHVGFGGPGPHFCLGAHLARREITVMLQELYRRYPDLHVTGEPEQLRSSFINGIKHLEVALA